MHVTIAYLQAFEVMGYIDNSLFMYTVLGGEGKVPSGHTLSDSDSMKIAAKTEVQLYRYAWWL